MTNKDIVTIIGGGLAGCEAAFQLLRQGRRVRLFEQRPRSKTPAHTGGNLAELVCSNSFRSNSLSSAPGLLKAEMRILGSLTMEAADNCRVPAGQALAVDRERFSSYTEERLSSHGNLEIIREEIREIPQEEPVIVATGPLTSEALAENLAALIGVKYLHFYDAIAPIVFADSIDEEIIFRASRYNKGEGEYINCPMNQEEYLSFLAALRSAEQYPIHDFEGERFFEGCLPIEEMAVRGDDVMRFGPLKPVGLPDPRTGKEPYAVVQLRQDDIAAEHYNIVGFQTRMRQAEQKRVVREIPGLQNAQFARLGQMHRNTYINAPEVLEPTYQVRGKPGLFIAGQLSGVEGYVESASSGLAAGLYMAQFLGEGKVDPLPPTTAIGALSYYVANAESKIFQPMNVTFGLLQGEEGIPHRPKRKRREAQAERALNNVREWAGRHDIVTRVD
ncbi:MAG TPA: methylenetetrahydrofolate--tRNA-(uracil(54)-C(5))-methyltransferase (FADH(2)-oxidizing) TrmFO [Acidobacteriota bacterium]|nr:methylenetetrahydrofolate--tRNA-(uracil(54)-C(5))-methyltransferase (FADH(2)-oxidizing) TrmFO [Acidobacteriota bacterium]